MKVWELLVLVVLFVCVVAIWSYNLGYMEASTAIQQEYKGIGR